MTVRWDQFAGDLLVYRKAWEHGAEAAGPAVVALKDQGTARLREELLQRGIDPTDENVLAGMLYALQLVRASIRRLRGNEAFYSFLDGLLLTATGGLIADLLPEGVAS